MCKYAPPGVSEGLPPALTSFRGQTSKLRRKGIKACSGTIRLNKAEYPSSCLLHRVGAFSFGGAGGGGGGGGASFPLPEDATCSCAHESGVIGCSLNKFQSSNSAKLIDSESTMHQKQTLSSLVSGTADSAVSSKVGAGSTIGVGSAVLAGSCVWTLACSAHKWKIASNSAPWHCQSPTPWLQAPPLRPQLSRPKCQAPTPQRSAPPAQHSRLEPKQLRCGCKPLPEFLSGSLCCQQNLQIMDIRRSPATQLTKMPHAHEGSLTGCSLSQCQSSNSAKHIDSESTMHQKQTLSSLVSGTAGSAVAAASTVGAGSTVAAGSAVGADSFVLKLSCSAHLKSDHPR